MDDSKRDWIVQHCKLVDGSCPRRWPCTGTVCLRKPDDEHINPLQEAQSEQEAT